MRSSPCHSRNPLGRQLLAFAALLLPGALPGQVAIYDVTFRQSEEQSINFAFFDGGYLALDLLTGTGSFLLTYRDQAGEGVQPSFVQAGQAVEAFTAVRAGSRKTVIRAFSQTATALAHYLATGLADQEITVDIQGESSLVPIASRLRGQVLASDNENDVAFSAGETSLGFAGVASFELTLNADRTARANRGREKLPDVVNSLADQLKLLGFVEARGE